ncbi:MAG: hypothetical protein VX503_01550 [Pseudomonadota bacterium]|nr:hypothetical protein [Pseudomonadota bacterium]
MAKSQPRPQTFTLIKDDPRAIEFIGLYPGCHGERFGGAFQIRKVDVRPLSPS